MGRTLPVPVQCQVCGDKSYGRHYGVYCCDGCSCFFKRSIRKAIAYTCISGDDACVIDKARRNWCPACRLKKCYAVSMNQTAVQEERGPRKRRQGSPGGLGGQSLDGQSGDFPEASPPVAKRQRRRREPKEPSEEGVPKAGALETTLVAQTLRLAAQGPVLRFASPAVRHAALERFWPSLVLLHAASLQSHFSTRLVSGASDAAEAAEEALRALALDPQELHLAASLALTSGPADLSRELASLGSLGDLYRIMLVHHAAAFHPNDQLRSAKVLLVIQKLVAVTAEDMGPVRRQLPSLLAALTAI